MVSPTDNFVPVTTPQLGGKGEVGKGEGREFRRQYVFAAATVMSNGKKTPGAMIKYGFPDATWVEGRRLHMAVSSVQQEWVEVTMNDRADALGRALALGSASQGPGAGERTMVFVNSSGACDEVTAELLRQGLKAAAFHADVASGERSDRLERLAAGDVTVLAGSSIHNPTKVTYSPPQLSSGSSLSPTNTYTANRV